jgi:hypothetical protein
VSDKPVRKVRDLSVWEEGDTTYVLACDANASVGELANDFMQRPPEEAGYNAAKVPLMEVLAVGARPFLVVNTLCGPLDAYGSRVVDGLRNALREARCDAHVTGSDETNMTTTQTGVGVTILGLVPTDQLRLGRSRDGDVVVCLGRPKDGVRVPYREGEDDVATPSDVVMALAAGAHEVLPVGSRGLAFEAAQLAAVAGLRLELDQSAALDLDASAGASTCFLATVNADGVAALSHRTRLPVNPLGVLRASGPDFTSPDRTRPDRANSHPK